MVGDTGYSERIHNETARVCGARVTHIVAAFLVPIHYQAIIGMALLSLGLKAFDSIG
jgi:hypothetical protein